MNNLNGMSGAIYPSAMITPFIRTLLEMRVLTLTVQFVPMMQFFSDVFSVITVLSATAQLLICVDLMVLCDETNDGAVPSVNNLSQSVKIF